MPDQANIMATVLQTSAGVSALLLVVQGYYLSSLSNLPATTQALVKNRYKRGMVYVLGALVLSTLVSIGAAAWLVGLDLFWVTMVGFGLSLLSVLVLSGLLTASAMRH